MTSDWERAHEFMSAFPPGTLFDQSMLATLIADIRREPRHGRQSCADLEGALAASCKEVVFLQRIEGAALDLATSLWPPGSAERQPAEVALRAALGLPERPEWSPRLSDDETQREAQLADLRRRRAAPYQRPCQGCRRLDEEHDFGPTCTLAEQST